VALKKRAYSEEIETDMKEGKTVKKISQSRTRRYAWAELLPA